MKLRLFFGLLILLPFLREATNLNWIALFDSFYRSGSLVFGGGHVVLPLLEREFVPTGWLSEEAFLAGYGAAQAVPGPLFTFAAYIGAVINGWQGGLLATAAIFLPAFLLILGSLPFWDALRRNSKISTALMGVNAAVVGLRIDVLVQSVWVAHVGRVAEVTDGSARHAFSNRTVGLGQVGKRVCQALLEGARLAVVGERADGAVVHHAMVELVYHDVVGDPSIGELDEVAVNAGSCPVGVRHAGVHVYLDLPVVVVV